MNNKILPQQFFAQDVCDVAIGLLGTELVHQSKKGEMAGIITETEAYLPFDDPANHASRGRTQRNASMFFEAGYWYVYLIYGIHYCLNIVTGPNNQGEAVLIRAITPTVGLNRMKQNRSNVGQKNGTNGPAKLTQALGIDTQWDGIYMPESTLYLRKTNITPSDSEITATPRVGISQATDQELRFVWQPPKFTSS